jgi:hypothetical protein
MSKLEVNAVEPQCGTNLTLGASGDTIIIPSGATISNQGTAAGFGPTGAVSWNTTKITADPNPAVTGVGYFADTTSAAFTITLPSSPSAGAVVGIADYANTFATNNITVDRNGSNIGGVAFNATLSVNGVSVTFVYVDATQGWIVTDSGQRSNLDTAAYIVATGGTITTIGDYKIHAFTGPGTFTVCSVGNPAGSDTIENLLIVAGGGGGGRSDIGAGGGAGGLRNLSSIPVTAQGYPITVGGGGAGQPSCAQGNDGTSSSGLTYTSAGGGGGGGGGPGFIARPGNNGGSGGGGACAAGVGGSGNTPPVSPPQGNNGAPGNVASIGGGGGGASAAATQPGGVGGAGLDVSPFFGTAPQPFYQANQPLRGATASGQFAGGGGGAGDAPGGNTGGDGGVGGGGKGSSPGNPAGQAGTTNSGGGGGAGENPRGASGAGGSGIVLIRYKFQN